MGVEIGKYGRTLIFLRMIGVYNSQTINNNFFRHIGWIPKVMLTMIRSSKKACAEWPACSRHKDTVANDEGSFPGAAIIRSQVDQVSSIQGGVFYCKCTATNGIDAHVPQFRIADRGVGNSHMSVEAGKTTMVQHQVFAEIGAHDSPILFIINIIGLAAVFKCHIQRPGNGYIITSHRNGHTGGTNCAVGFSAGKNAVSDSDIGTITKGQKSAIGSTMLFLSCNIMLESIHHYVGSHDGNASSIIGIFGSCLIGNGGKFPSSDCKFLLIHGKCRN